MPEPRRFLPPPHLSPYAVRQRAQTSTPSAVRLGHAMEEERAGEQMRPLLTTVIERGGRGWGKSWGDRRRVPLPSQPGLSAVAAVPLCGGGARRLFSRPAAVAKEAPPAGTLTHAVIQNSASCCRLLPLSQVSVQEPCGEGYGRLRPPPSSAPFSSVHLQATVRVARAPNNSIAVAW